MKGEVDVFGNLDYLEVMNHTRVVDELEERAVHGRGLQGAGRFGDLGRGRSNEQELVK